jgi:hypothetical protein
VPVVPVVLVLPFVLFGLTVLTFFAGTVVLVAVVIKSVTEFWVPFDAKTGVATSTQISPTAAPNHLTREILTAVFIRLLKGDDLICF